MTFISYVEKVKDILYRVIYIIMICGSILFLGNHFLGIEEIEIKHLLESLLFIGIIFLICCFHAKGRMIISSVLLVCFIMQWLLLGTEEIRNIYLGYFLWIEGTGYNDDYLEYYYAIQIFLVVCFCFAVTFILEQSKIARTILFLATIIFTGYLITFGINVSKAGVMFLLTYLVISLSEFIENYWKKQRVSQNRQLYLVWLWPAWILVLFITFISPSSPEPFRWDFVRNVISSIDTRFTVFTQWVRSKGTEDFGMSMAGFSTDARLLGDTLESSKILFNIRSEKTMVSNAYLSGITYQDFDGREWTNNDPKIKIDERIDTVETVYDVYLNDKGNQSHYYQSNRLFFEYQYFSTRYYFTPQKMLTLYNNKGKSYLEQTDDEERNKSKFYGEEYSVSFLEINPNAASELGLFNSIDDENVLREASNACRVGNLTVDKLQYYRDEIYKQYAKPVELSDAMKSFISSLTSDCDTKYEKLIKLEEYLSSLKYTLSPGELPGNIDCDSKYLDYFIFEKQEGYCTYFATSFTLLARALGLPARYVQGFCVPMIGKKTMEVTSQMSHAWSEVYFDGLGWVIFEATPGYGQIRYTDWNDKSDKKVDYSDMYNYYMKISNEAAEQPPEVVDKPAKKVDIVRRILVILLGAVLIAISVGLIILADYFIKREKYKRLDNESKLKWEMDRVFILLKRLDITKEDYETLGELNLRICDRYKEWGLEEPIFISDYEEVLYGDRQVDISMIDAVINQKNILREKVRLQRKKSNFK